VLFCVGAMLVVGRFSKFGVSQATQKADSGNQSLQQDGGMRPAARSGGRTRRVAFHESGSVWRTFSSGGASSCSS
jgi:hypothetical protein